jgi:HSP20 family protein
MNDLTRQQNRERGAQSSSDRGSGSPVREVNRLRNRLSSLFGSPFEDDDFLAPVTSFFEGWTPGIELYDDKEKFTVLAELPGMKKEDIDVSVSGDTLTISGEKKHDEERKEGDTYRSERFFGRFQRSITLPQPVDTGRIEAHYKDGILSLTLPKAESAKRKQIEIKPS